MVITELFGDPVGDTSWEGGHTRSGLRYLLPSPTPSDSDSSSNNEGELDNKVIVVASTVVRPLIWDMEGTMKGPRRYSGAVGTIELGDFIQEFDTWCDMMALRTQKGQFTPFMAWKGLFQHLDGPPMDDYHDFARDNDVDIELWRQHWSPNYVLITRGEVSASGTTPATPGSSGSGATVAVGPVPKFNPVAEFFTLLKKNYQGVRTDKLKSLTEFERKTGESLREAYTRMRRLILVTNGVTDAQAVQFWYRILDKDLKRRVQDATLMHNSSPTLAYVFALSEKIELNMAEEKVVTVGFSMNPPTSSSGQGKPQGSSGGESWWSITISDGFRRDRWRKVLTLVCWSTARTIVLDVWRCAFAERLSPRKWWASIRDGISVQSGSM